MVSTRQDALRLLLATALVSMCVSTLGTLTGLASWPLIQFVQDHANVMVELTVAIVNSLTIALFLWGARAARLRAIESPASIWGRNAALLDLAIIVASVYLAGTVVSYVGEQLKWFVQIPIGNATQIDMFSPAAHFCFSAVIPAIGAAILLVASPRLLHGDSGHSEEKAR